MARKILKTLTNNLGLKILAVIFAFIMWLAVYNIDDPNKTKTFTTNVTVENESAIREMNKCYEVINGTNTVSFSVSAKRSVLDKLEDTDFQAVADMNRMVIDATGEKASIPIEISCKRGGSSLKYNGKNKYLQIAVEDLMSRRFMITADTKGEVAQGYALGEVVVTNPNVLNVAGPASIVEKIDKVVATIDVEGMSSNLSDNVIPVLYDAKGEEVDITRLTLSNTTVTISAKILNVKELPLHFGTTGTPYGAYRVVEIDSDPKTVKLKGASNVLNPLTALAIPDSVLDVTSAKEEVKTTIDITEYLPEGAELVDPKDATVTVTVRIEAYESQNYQIDADNIIINGLDDNYKVVFQSNKIPVMINGLRKDLDKLNVESLSPTIDVTGLGEGEHQVTLTLVLDEGMYAYQEVILDIEIVAVEDEEDGDSSEEESGE